MQDPDPRLRLSEPFTILDNMAPRITHYDSGHTLYSSYLALHVNHQAAWFSMQICSETKYLE